MLMKRFSFFFISILVCINALSQFTIGTTGLLNMPTAVMQQDKTFMFGGGFLEKHATPARWTYNTYNYYINITFFSWLEVAYDCTLHKAIECDPVYGCDYWPEQTWGKFTNQDRNFSIRLRLLREGQWWKYMPAIVIGSNDVTTRPGGDRKTNFSNPEGDGNGYWNRYYLVATKHLAIKNIGELGVHFAYVYNKRTDYPLYGPAFGANFRFQLSDSQFLTKAVNNLNLMAEYDSRTINCGFEYSFWKDYINAVVELNRCRYFSGGLVFKVHLK